MTSATPISSGFQLETFWRVIKVLGFLCRAECPSWQQNILSILNKMSGRYLRNSALFLLEWIPVMLLTSTEAINTHKAIFAQPVLPNGGVSLYQWIAKTSEFFSKLVSPWAPIQTAMEQLLHTCSLLSTCLSSPPLPLLSPQSGQSGVHL